MELSTAIELSNKLKKETFFTNPLFIYQNCFVEKDMLFENEKVEDKHPLLVYSDEYKDVSKQIIGTGFDEDIEQIKKKYIIVKKEDLGIEFFYSTDDWIKLEGSNFKKIRNQIKKFKKDYEFKILQEYPKNEIIKFLEEWAKEKRKKEVGELTKELFEHELDETKRNLDYINKCENKKLYIESEGRLLGFAVAIKSGTGWVFLIQKNIHGITGLTQLFYHLISKEMGPGKVYASGAEAQDPNMKAFKESLRPIKTKKIYTIHVGEKI